MLNFIAKILRRKNDSNVQMQIAGYANDVIDAPLLQPLGIVAGVTPQAEVVAINLGKNSQNTVLLPIRINKLQPAHAGDVMIYATNTNGNEDVGHILLTHDGKLQIATKEDDLLAIMQEILQVLQQLQTFGSPTTQTPTPDWLLQVAQLEQRLNAMANYM